MAVPKKKTSKSRKNMRRAHDFLTAPSLSVCPQCKSPKMPHRACPSCGTYKGKEVAGAAKQA
ncbi:50S ribosomal protein L32 [Trichlorobacter lovleyi]|jgi:large subunit ribosomal protein L32|uniref:Large ribosomal subunit protein bL32 n=1 Tax=Trichlorobacter lovleyi (strain ATCC BAA-1151 / DSM 17278 / SZ) TaxID=398767 RepID=RL32_TRIL1|nr:50S ribosomal protein L32 [Trichlorobacter lovleyi]B3E2K0.1 RecName: Full=Large ribosomal subunit protein bL32; AltName: Full=50S ribosomal protein L32 [Trichlorobacter lovleyi SZ]ACD95657.1 ribosomal protein L32 [Trichlorobacter lovleyi SZ]QOX79011.1 50S ribosomal protein L32 [Trichlorobacter lovleyi]